MRMRKIFMVVYLRSICSPKNISSFLSCPPTTLLTWVKLSKSISKSRIHKTHERGDFIVPNKLIPVSDLDFREVLETRSTFSCICIKKFALQVTWQNNLGLVLSFSGIGHCKFVISVRWQVNLISRSTLHKKSPKALSLSPISLLHSLHFLNLTRNQASFPDIILV